MTGMILDGVLMLLLVAALASLREASQETDMLHDRIVKAREVKQQLEVLMVRAPVREAAPAKASCPSRRALSFFSSLMP